MFSDRATIYVEAGRGGDGSVAFRREKFVPRGGPSGGDGGPGGDVILVADDGRRDLHELRLRPHVRAGRGTHGQGANRAGARGEDRVARVPVGTQVFTDDGALFCDLAHDGARVVVAEGGRGGPGNRHFATSTRRAPRICGLGEVGDVRTLELRLKLLADAALLGFPNVGKSSLLRRISNAKPKVADYPFTTIEPVLGVVDLPNARQLTVIDVPGLLEGASDGVGLGHEFLAHLERARLLLHVVRAEEAAEDLDAARRGMAVIAAELEKHGHGLADRPRVVVANRLDLVPSDARAPVLESLSTAIAAGGAPGDERVVQAGGRPIVVGTSCATGEGIEQLIATLAQVVPEVPVDEDPLEPELADYLVYRPVGAGRRRPRVLRDEGQLRVVAPDLEELAARADRGDRAAVEALHAALDAAGVIATLRRAGAKDGDAIALGGIEFEFVRDQVT